MFCGLDKICGTQKLLLISVVILLIILGIVIYLYKTYKNDVKELNNNNTELVIEEFNELPQEPSDLEQNNVKIDIKEAETNTETATETTTETATETLNEPHNLESENITLTEKKNN